MAASIPEMAVNALSRNPNISYIELDGEVYALGHSLANSGIEYQNAWGVDHIQADLVHSYYKGADVYVCVVDTGIDYNHSDLYGRYKGGYDYVSDDNDPMDDNGHGTHVSGTVAAVLNNAGVAGAAPDAYLYGVKVLNKRGSGWWSDVAAGIQWCVNNNADIISMSLGGRYSASVESAVNTAYNNGILLVAAAGNNGEGTDTVIYPAKFDAVMAVAATDQNDNRASFSSTGPAVEISAPGVSIQSTVPDNKYAWYSGTSMATPHVSGVAALIWSKNSALTNVQVRDILDSTAQDLGAPGRDNSYGYGLVRADLAVPNGDSGGSSETVPSAPQNLQATAGNAQVGLSWDAPSSDGGSTITGYKIYRSTTSNSETYLADVGNVLAYTDNAVSNGVTYYYKVSAVNSVGESALSNESSATPTAPATAPSTPQNLVATASDKQVALSWDAPSSDGGSSITNYKIYRSTTSGSETYLTQVGNVLTYTDNGLTNGQTYYYYVTAVSSVGESSASNEASATPAAPAPTPTMVIVDSIVNSGEGGRFSNQHVVITVWLVDDLGNPVSGASVSVDVLRSTNGGSTYSYYSSGSGTAGSDGKVVFKVIKPPSGCYKGVATNVVASALAWDGVSPNSTPFCK